MQLNKVKIKIPNPPKIIIIKITPPITLTIMMNGENPKLAFDKLKIILMKNLCSIVISLLSIKKSKIYANSLISTTLLKKTIIKIPGQIKDLLD
jgi:hypothetical protein